MTLVGLCPVPAGISFWLSRWAILAFLASTRNVALGIASSSTVLLLGHDKIHFTLCMRRVFSGRRHNQVVADEVVGEPKLPAAGLKVTGCPRVRGCSLTTWSPPPLQPPNLAAWKRPDLPVPGIGRESTRSMQ